MRWPAGSSSISASSLFRFAGATRASPRRTVSRLLRERIAELETSADVERELAATISPLAGTLAQVERQVATLERDRVEQYARLDEQLAAVTAGGEALRAQTAALAAAVRSLTARGAWGEVQLLRVVEHAGMLPPVDVTAQAVGSTPDGAAVQPDLVVHRPAGKHVVVDAKAPLAAFLEAGEGGHDAALQEQAALAHAKALRAHLDALAAKEHWRAFDPSPEIAICLLPG